MSSPHAPFEVCLCLRDRGVLVSGNCFGNGGEKQGWEHSKGDGTYLGRDNVYAHNESNGGDWATPEVSVLSSNRESEIQTKPMPFAGLWSRMVLESRKTPKLQSLNSARRDTWVSWSL